MSQASHARVLHGFLQNAEFPLGFKSPDVHYSGKLEEESTKNFQSMPPVAEKVIDNHRPLLLNLLPKETVPPPSGPAKESTTSLVNLFHSLHLRVYTELFDKNFSSCNYLI